MVKPILDVFILIYVCDNNFDIELCNIGKI